MTILLFKRTTDSDLSRGLQVCYPNVYGQFTKIGTIVKITIDRDGVINYVIEGEKTKDDINTAMGAYTADELKLIVKTN